MRRTGLSNILGAVVLALCGQSHSAYAEPATTGKASVAPEGQSAPEAGSEAPANDSTARPRLSDASELERIVSLYSGGKYEECTREVAHLLDPANPERLRNPQVVEDARLYHATCLVMSGRDKEAIAPLRAALTHNPTMGTPDSLTFPPPLISLFLQVRKEFADAIKAEEKKRLEALTAAAEKLKANEEAERQRVKKLETLAGTESVVQTNSRFVASLPFGTGQYQNGKNTLGTVFLVSEAMLLGTSLGAVAVIGYQYTLVDPRAYGSDITRNVRIARTVSIISFYGFAAVAVGGIAEAHINFVPEIRYERKRKLPKELLTPASRQRPGARVAPWVAPQTGGLSVGVVGVF